MRVEVDVLVSPSLIVLMVSLNIELELRSCVKISNLVFYAESAITVIPGRSCVKAEVAVLNSLCGFCGRKATLNDVHASLAQPTPLYAQCSCGTYGWNTVRTGGSSHWHR